MKTFNLPDLGEGLPDAEIQHWYVKVGDFIEEDAPLVAMETAKAVIDVPSPFTGTILQLHGQAGDLIHTNHPLVSYQSASSDHEDLGTVVGTLQTSNQLLAALDTPASAPCAMPAKPRIQASPAVRALAKELGVDLATLTSISGAITLADVKKAAQSDQPVFEPLKGFRRTMAQTMIKAHAEVVPVTIQDDAYLPTNFAGDLTIHIIQAIIYGLKAEPALNAWFDQARFARCLHAHIALGIAVDTEQGLFLPVIPEIDKVPAAQLRAKINQFKQQATNNSFKPETLQGATFVLSNFGVFAGRYANPIVTPPSVAILGVGALRPALLPTQPSQLTQCLPLSLSFDHRAVTGGEAARCLAAMIHALQSA